MQVISYFCELIQTFRTITKVRIKLTDAELLLRIYCLQQGYNLSDPGAEDAIKDRLSFQRFLRLDPFVDAVPDATTILNFRHLLENNDLQAMIFKRDAFSKGLEDISQSEPRLLSNLCGFPARLVADRTSPRAEPSARPSPPGRAGPAPPRRWPAPACCRNRRR